MENPDAKTAPFFEKQDWSAFWTATVLAFIVYVYTLCPTVGLEDSGELAVAADWLGVPHPPGYPIWTMLGWVFARLFAFVQYRGQPNPAYGIGMLSAVCGALAAGCTALLIGCSGRRIIASSPLLGHETNARNQRAICWISAVTASLLFAFAPIMWSQAVIIEVYSLNALFLMVVMTLIYVWTQRPNAKTLLWASFIFGLGLTNYQVILLAGFALAVCIMLRDFALFRDYMIAAAPYALVFILFKLGVLPEIVHPLHWTAWLYLTFNIVWLVVAFFVLPHGRTVSLCILLAQVGVAFYAYMPIVSDLRNPPMNWAYPRTWEGFKHAISRGQYEAIEPAHILSPRFIQQMGTYVADLTQNFQLPLVLIGFLPFAAWRVSWRGRKLDMIPAALLLTALASILLPFHAVGPAYKLPALGVALLMAAGGLLIVVDRIEAMIQDHLASPDATVWEKLTALAVLALIALAGIGLVARDIIDDTRPLREAAGPLPREQFQTIMGELAFTVGVTLFMLTAVTVIVWLHRRKIVTLSVNVHSRQWLMATTITFVILSIGLIALADLKMDIQDTFIQRVKFISSHALFAMWIGYGLIFTLSALEHRLSRDNPLATMALIVTACLPLVPLAVNQWNQELLRVYGGAEQIDRDFGWQFGNYQLRGAEAILEELSPDEEPPPNPVYPPPMGREAIFFGGTDPGRFVPTYMIYSADVRPDVYLITQNALADNTYLQVMRDLYGNDIWIPSVTESSEAFRVFVDEVQSGKREAHAGITIQDGRVQVSGVMGVMEINGILARMIFDRNTRHDFYVEESYVIRWMYPHQVPHGLIMKIDREPLPFLPPETVTNDMDFWDWYTRRLISRREFQRDVVARKSFSKLRSALAGLYAYRGMLDEAEHAFLEAYLLYPLSPEANFRLAEVYMRRRQFDEAEAVIAEFSRQDPANERAGQFLGQIGGLRQAWARIETLQREAPEGRMAPAQALELLSLYRQVGDMGNFEQLSRSMLDNESMPPGVLFDLARQFEAANRRDRTVQALDKVLERLTPDSVRPGFFIQAAQMYGRAQRPDRMRDTMDRYLAREPGDWRAWLDHATLSLRLQEPETAVDSLRQAIRHGGQEAERTIAGNPHLAPLHRAQQDRHRRFMNLPDSFQP